MSGIIYIAAGMGYNPLDKEHSEYLDEKYHETPDYHLEVWNTWAKHRDETLAVIKQLPSHYQFLKNTIYNQ
jgi:hypothetical protein